ncbi:MAG: HNH endonuclease [Candidatus Marsarchaeota archaeon]|nr:HNH endonuclease [Candidatus Marsarchaeota archaeon]
MATYSEPELIIPTLSLLKEHSAGLRMSQIIHALLGVLAPSGHDMDIISGRADTYFSQKVRNLKSHDTLTRKGLATYNNGIFKITDAGLRYIEENVPIHDALVSQGFSQRDIDQEIESDYDGIIIEEGAGTERSAVQRERSGRLRNTALREFKRRNGGKLECLVCGFDFEKKYGELGRDYIEIHHRSPVHLMDIQGTQTRLSEALEKVVPLCSNCHRMVHRKRSTVLSPEELKHIVITQEGRQ